MTTKAQKQSNFLVFGALRKERKKATIYKSVFLKMGVF